MNPRHPPTVRPPERSEAHRASDSERGPRASDSERAHGASEASDAHRGREAPKPAGRSEAWAALRQIGPGLIITASIVGSGELIMTPRLGAQVGFTLLWFIIFGCIVKVFVQVELARHAIFSGQTTLEAMNSVPGPRLRVSWLLWLWAAMFVGTVFQVGGIVGGIAQVFAVGGVQLPQSALALAVAASCSLLLSSGRYRLVERGSTLMVFLFTLCTIFAIAALQRTAFRITAANIGEGLRFDLPPDFTIAFAAFGLIGVGATELIYYPYWCLEKGYARDARSASSVAVRRRWLRVLMTDAWVSLVIYTGATVAFYLLGAAVLHAMALSVTDVDPIGTLSRMYRETFGAWGLFIFLLGAFNVLYSTIFVSSASNARLLVDAAVLFGALPAATAEARARRVRLACFALPLVSAIVYLGFGNPVTLVQTGAIAQALMLPFLAGSAVYFSRRDDDGSLRRSRWWMIGLWVSTLAMTIVGVYQLWGQLAR